MVMFAVPRETPRTVMDLSSGAPAGGSVLRFESGPQAVVPESGPSWKVIVEPFGSSLAMLSLVELKPSSRASPASTLHPPSPSSDGGYLSEAAITLKGTARVSPSLILTSSNCCGAGVLSRRLVTVSANAEEANASVSAAVSANTLNMPPLAPRKPRTNVFFLNVPPTFHTSLSPNPRRTVLSLDLLVLSRLRGDARLQRQSNPTVMRHCVSSYLCAGLCTKIYREVYAGCGGLDHPCPGPCRRLHNRPRCGVLGALIMSGGGTGPSKPRQPAGRESRGRCQIPRRRLREMSRNSIGPPLSSTDVH